MARNVPNYMLKNGLWIIFLCFCGVAHAQTGTLTVKITGFKNNQGKAQAALYNNAEAFPSDLDGIYRIGRVTIQNNTATIVFESIPYGEYAVAVYHDENDSKELETNWLGIPQEGYGFSNNVKVTFSPPKFKEASVKVGDTPAVITIILGY